MSTVPNVRNNISTKVRFVYKFIGGAELDERKLMSRFLQKVIKEEQVQRANSPKSVVMKNRQKIDEYARLIKDLHPPKVSKLKKKEMKALKEAIVNPRDWAKKPKIKDLEGRLTDKGIALNI